MKMDMTEVCLVCTKILPKAIKKTILAKKMINHGEVRTVNEAVISAAVHTTNIRITYTRSLRRHVIRLSRSLF